ncbi:MAG: hypothetical protein ACREEB_12795 [Caulobacteraceae bacterium]
MISIAAEGPRGFASRRFAPFHRWDRNFFLAMVALIWLGILMGFVPEIAAHFQKHKPPYPLIIPIHGAAFVGWLVLLTTQVLLIRARRPDIHRRLGVAGAFLAMAMIVIGPVTAIVMQRVEAGTAQADPAFVIIQFTDILGFAGLTVAALALRGLSSSHKRLILLASMFISDAGFARWLGGPITAWLGAGYWATFASLYLGNDVLILGLGAYDLVTRRRLHPVYLAGLAWIASLQLTEVWIYLSPWWKPVALRLIGH